MSNEKLVERILTFTFRGSVVEWPNRLADVAAEIGVKIEMVNWHETPYNICQQILRLCTSQERLELAMVMSVARSERLPRLIEKTQHRLKIYFPEAINITAGQFIELTLDSKSNVTLLKISRAVT